MTKIDWKAKLSSRKFWAAIIGFVAAIAVAFGVPDLQIEQITGIIMASATLIAYIIGEGMVDAARLKNEITLVEPLTTATQTGDTESEG